MKALLLIIFLLLLSCNPPPINHLIGTPYFIFPGTHESYELPLPIPTNDISFEVTTNKTWNWNWRNNDDNDISKIAGIYWGKPHATSVRIGYRRLEDGKYQFWYYIWEKGNSPQSDYGKKYKLKSLMWEGYHLPKKIYCRTGYIKSNNEFIIKVNDTTIRIPTVFVPDYWILAGFAFPYVGGNNTVEKTWIIVIKFI